METKMDFIICYTDSIGHPVWEGVSGEDAMQERVCELVELYNLNADEDILVFDMNDKW